MNCELCSKSTFKKTPFYYLWNNKEFTLVQCKTCGLIMQSPLPDKIELTMLYADDYFEQGAHGLNITGESYENSRDKLTLAQRTEFIKTIILKYHPQAESIFEIGFAMGHLLDAAKTMGLKTSGMEFSESAVLKAKEKFQLQVKAGNFEESTDIGSWDVIYGGDVFEHFTRPSKVVENLYQHLNSDGMAILIIPSTFNLFSTKLASLVFRISGKRKKMYDKPYHVFEYTSATIKKMLLKEFKEVRIVNMIKKPSQLNLKSGGIEYQLKYLLHFINYPFTKLFNRNGDRLLVIAKK